MTSGQNVACLVSALVPVEAGSLLVVGTLSRGLLLTVTPCTLSHVVSHWLSGAECSLVGAAGPMASLCVPSPQELG